jgi:hypothetical protein
MRIGTGKCLNPKCGREVVVMETSGGAVNWSCRYCGLTSYAKKVTDANANLRELMTPAAPAAPPASPPAEPKKEKKLPWMP